MCVTEPRDELCSKSQVLASKGARYAGNHVGKLRQAQVRFCSSRQERGQFIRSGLSRNSFLAGHLLLEAGDWLLLGLNILCNDLVILDHICAQDMWVALVTLDVAGDGRQLLDFLPMGLSSSGYCNMHTRSAGMCCPNVMRHPEQQLCNHDSSQSNRLLIIGSEVQPVRHR